MGVAVPNTAIQVQIAENRSGVLAKWVGANTLGTTDTWVTGLGTIEAVLITDSVSGHTVGATISGGTVTFANSATLTAPVVLAIGYL